MNEQNPPRPSGLAPDSRLLPVLLFLFAGSGCSALVYEIVWLQLLQLVIGSSSVSLGVLLGTFMGGMCLGSLALARMVSMRRHPLRVYGALELGIGLIGMLLPWGIPYVGRLYVEAVGYGTLGILLRGAVCAVCLVPPTMLMGATLPAIARWVETTPQGISRLGFFYGANIAGAVFGCLLAGFYLLRIYGTVTATYVAVAMNASVALASFLLAARNPHHHRADVEASPKPWSPARATWPVYVTIALSGFCAMGAEVIWTRQLSLMLGASVYTFSIILAVFLMGLGIGSTFGAWLSREAKRPHAALGWFQLLSAVAVSWTAYMLAKSLPHWPIDPSLATSPWFTFQLDLMRCVWAVLPPTCLWGASFPLALAAAASRGQDPGRLAGAVYAANTVGAILGAVGFSMLVIAWVGTRTAQQTLVVLSAVAAGVMFVSLLWQTWRERSHAWAQADTAGQEVPASRRARAVGLGHALVLVGMTGIAAPLAWMVPETDRGLIAYGRYLPTWVGQADFIYVGEGGSASIAVSELDDGTRNFHVSGKVVASSDSRDMRLQRMLGHVPALIHPHPRSVLVVGCGAGVTAGSFVVHPEVERIVICEIEPIIPPAAAEYFGLENHYVMDDPRVKIVYDDARHYVLTTKETFDIITSDPIHPWVKGAASMFSQEYFELCKRRLNPNGVVAHWVPLYESNLAAVKSEIFTFLKAFPDGDVWSNEADGQGYDIVLMGQAGPITINVDELQARLEREDYGGVFQSLDEVHLGTAVEILATFAGRGARFRPWLKGAELNRDRDLRLQYLAGMGLNSYEADRIYRSLGLHNKYPDDLAQPTRPRGQTLRIDGQQRTPGG